MKNNGHDKQFVVNGVRKDVQRSDVRSLCTCQHEQQQQEQEQQLLHRLNTLMGYRDVSCTKAEDNVRVFCAQGRQTIHGDGRICRDTSQSCDSIIFTVERRGYRSTLRAWKAERRKPRPSFYIPRLELQYTRGTADGPYNNKAKAPKF